MPALLLATTALKPGMVTAEIVCTDKQIILQDNTVLTSNIIRRLPSWGVCNIKVKKHLLYADTDGTLLVENLQAMLLRENPAFVEQYSKATKIAGKLFGFMREREGVPYNELAQLATSNLYKLLRTKSILGNLYRLKSYTDYTFLHAVNVGILSGLLAIWSGLPEEEIKTLVLCGVMHDIGKSQIPLSILDKPGKLTPEERRTINLHPEYGYYMTKSIPGLRPEIQHAVLQHHERENGGGYPGGLSDPSIHPYAKIVAIADTYDALTTEKVYQKSVTPFRALEILQEQMFVFMEKDYCKNFIRNVIYNLVGSTVLLSDGTQAEVLQMGHYMSCKPVVSTSSGMILDLHLNPNLSVIEILNFRS